MSAWVQEIDADTLAAAEYDSKVGDWLTKLDASDVLDELVDAEGELQAAIKKNDPECIGRIFLNVRKAYARYLTDRELYDADKPAISTQQAAAMAIYGESL